LPVDDPHMAADAAGGQTIVNFEYVIGAADFGDV
tara:strand:- start:113 stop:214 length:102 start_codon:yes stop_codon:yes gene_type:complete